MTDVNKELTPELEAQRLLGEASELTGFSFDKIKATLSIALRIQKARMDILDEFGIHSEYEVAVHYYLLTLRN